MCPPNPAPCTQDEIRGLLVQLEVKVDEAEFDKRWKECRRTHFGDIDKEEFGPSKHASVNSSTPGGATMYLSRLLNALARTGAPP